MPGLALYDHIVAGAIFLRAGIAKSGDGTIDDRGATSPYGLITETQSIHGSRAEVLDQHVRPIDEPPEHLLAAFALQVECDALLVAVDGQEIGGLVALERRSKGACIVALARPLHLDYLGAEITEQHGAVRPRENPREIKDAETFERSHASVLKPVRRPARRNRPR
jgi:hypothetical protein